jgi:hypothetical protein
MRGDQPNLDGVHAGLYQQRRLRRIRRLSFAGHFSGPGTERRKRPLFLLTSFN